MQYNAVSSINQQSPNLKFIPLAILQVRVYAVYLLNKRVLAFTLICYIISSAAAIWIISNNLRSSPGQSEHLLRSCRNSVLKESCVSLGVARPIPNGKTCLHPSLSASIYAVWIVMLLFDLALFSLIVAKGVNEYRAYGSSIFRGGRSLFGILIRDSVLYFLVYVFSSLFEPVLVLMPKISILIAYLVTLIAWLTIPVSSTPLPF